MKSVSFVIPTLNEADCISRTISSIPVKELEDAGWSVEVIVVDGGSHDGTAEIAREMGARVVFEYVRGYGRAYLTGFRAARGDFIVTSDGDNTYSLDVVPRVLRLMEERGLDFVVADRFRIFERGAWSPVYFFGNRVLSFLVRVLFGLRVRDSQSGMWFFRRDILKRMRFISSGMDFSTEIKLEAWRATKGFTEFPVFYRRRRGGVKKLNWLRDGLRIMLFLLKKRVLMWLGL
ncbi:MAG: glycosyltransferase family 2 protein [Candidatus Jordarchaeales archaeon]